MAYIAADKDKTIHIFTHNPIRIYINFDDFWGINELGDFTEISHKQCKQLINSIPKWEDEPIII